MDGVLSNGVWRAKLSWQQVPLWSESVNRVVENDFLQTRFEKKILFQSLYGNEIAYLS